jgi:hypothetical protein
LSLTDTLSDGVTTIQDALECACNTTDVSALTTSVDSLTTAVNAIACMSLDDTLSDGTTTVRDALECACDTAAGGGTGVSTGPALYGMNCSPGCRKACATGVSGLDVGVIVSCCGSFYQGDTDAWMTTPKVLPTAEGVLTDGASTYCYELNCATVPTNCDVVDVIFVDNSTGAPLRTDCIRLRDAAPEDSSSGDLAQMLLAQLINNQQAGPNCPDKAPTCARTSTGCGCGRCGY